MCWNRQKYCHHVCSSFKNTITARKKEGKKSCAFIRKTRAAALLSSHLPLCFCCKNSRKRYSSFDLLSVDLNLATLFWLPVLHNSPLSPSQRSCQIIVGEHSARNQGLHIIAAIITHPQTPNYTALVISINDNVNTPALTTEPY